MWVFWNLSFENQNDANYRNKNPSMIHTCPWGLTGKFGIFCLFSQPFFSIISVHSPWWDEVSNEAKDFIKNLLVHKTMNFFQNIVWKIQSFTMTNNFVSPFDPSRRFTAAQALKHPWLNNNSNSTKVLNTIDNMRQFNRNRRLKATVRVVQMSNMDLVSKK